MTEDEAMIPEDMIPRRAAILAVMRVYRDERGQTEDALDAMDDIDKAIAEIPAAPPVAAALRLAKAALAVDEHDLIASDGVPDMGWTKWNLRFVEIGDALVAALAEFRAGEGGDDA